MNPSWHDRGVPEPEAADRLVQMSRGRLGQARCYALQRAADTTNPNVRAYYERVAAYIATKENGC